MSVEQQRLVNELYHRGIHDQRVLQAIYEILVLSLLKRFSSTQLRRYAIADW